jgi:hypothetical protein
MKPAGQASQTFALVLLNFPDAHSSQNSMLNSSCALPGKHIVQLDAPVSACTNPEGQDSHGVVVPAALANFPFSHASHSKFRPMSSALRPGGQ